MQRYFAKEIIEDKVVLFDDDIHHIKHVMRMNNGDIIQVVYSKVLYEARINNLVNNDIRVIKKLEQYDDKYPEINLIIPTLNEQKLDYILQKGTEIGINSFTIVPFLKSLSASNEIGNSIFFVSPVSYLTSSAPKVFIFTSFSLK